MVKIFKKLVAFFLEPWYTICNGGDMTRPKFISRKISMHITEYKREDYDDVVKTCLKFFKKSQFERDYTGEDATDIFTSGTVWSMSQTPEECSYGEVLYGVLDFNENRQTKIVKLMSVIDSSD